MCFFVMLPFRGGWLFVVWNSGVVWGIGLVLCTLYSIDRIVRCRFPILFFLFFPSFNSSSFVSNRDFFCVAALTWWMAFRGGVVWGPLVPYAPSTPSSSATVLVKGRAIPTADCIPCPFFIFSNLSVQKTQTD